MERGGGSRLLQMQARFQQKQMAEREIKIASLYEAQQARALDRVHRSPASTTTSSSTNSPAAHHERVQPGKVRQMFQERRTKGVDKSYPLQPIQNTDRARKPANGVTKVSTNKVRNVDTKTKSRSDVNGVRRKTDNLVNGSGDLNHNHVTDINHNNKHVIPRNGELTGEAVDELDNELLENETFPDALAPEATPRSPEPKKPPRRSPAVKKATPPPVVSPRITASDNVVPKAREPMKKVANPVQNRQSVVSTVKSRVGVAAAAAAAAGGAGEACGVCGRRFAPDRLAKHEGICRKAATKKRKPFDVLKHRLAGTEAEQLLPKLRKGASTPAPARGKPLNSSWRQKHEEFINAIRAAKEVQAHIRAGGKLSDLPPPPPSENPDYVKCPHCARRFNQAAAERHIPKCKDFQFNKPKPAARKR